MFGILTPGDRIYRRWRDGDGTVGSVKGLPSGESTTWRRGVWVGGLNSNRLTPFSIAPHGVNDTSPAAASPDNATEELIALVRAGDRGAFDALASCLMPLEQIAECWAGTRVRLGLAP